MGKRSFLEGFFGIILIVGGLLAAGYFLLLYASGFTSVAATAPGPPAPAPVLIDLWDAYEQALAAAQARMGDAQLVSASAQWQVASEEALLSGVGNWSFVFYSAAESSVLDVVAGAGGAQVVNQTRVWTASKVMAVGDWQTGPRDALLVFLAHGGRAFLEAHPQSVVDLHLSETEGYGPTWAVVALDVNDRSFFSASVDADTMQVLASS